MSEFKKKKILETNDQIALALCQARLDLDLSLEQAAIDLQTKAEYLRALEEGEFTKLPDGIYGRNILREYSRRLGLSSKEILALFDEMNNVSPKKVNDPFSRKLPPMQYFLRLPRLARNSILIIIALVFFSYLGYYFINLGTPPEIVLLYPLKDIATNDSSILVQGRAKPETEITINGNPILQDSEGYFSRNVNLNPGLNVITVIGKRKYSREQIITRNIKYEEKEREGEK